MVYWLVILIGLTGGVMVGLQGPIVGSMGQQIGATASSLVVHMSGAVLSFLLLFFRNGEKVSAIPSLPWYMLLSGIFGVVLFQTIYVTLPRLGSTMMIVLIIIGQLLIGLVIDHFGLLGVVTRPIDLTRVLGVAVLILGGYLIAR